MTLFRTGLTIFAAFACGAVTAAVFVSRPISTFDDNVEPAVASTPAAAAPAPPAAEQQKPAPDRPQPRVIPLDQSSAQSPQTTGAGSLAATAGAAQSVAAGAAGSCNQDACARAYQSFDSASCTYQPMNGPRRRCSK